MQVERKFEGQTGTDLKLRSAKAQVNNFCIYCVVLCCIILSCILLLYCILLIVLYSL